MEKKEKEEKRPKKTQKRTEIKRRKVEILGQSGTLRTSHGTAGDSEGDVPLRDGTSGSWRKWPYWLLLPRRAFGGKCRTAEARGRKSPGPSAAGKSRALSGASRAPPEKAEWRPSSPERWPEVAERGAGSRRRAVGTERPRPVRSRSAERGPRRSRERGRGRHVGLRRVRAAAQREQARCGAGGAGVRGRPGLDAPPPRVGRGLHWAPRCAAGMGGEGARPSPPVWGRSALRPSRTPNCGSSPARSAPRPAHGPRPARRPRPAPRRRTG